MQLLLLSITIYYSVSILIAYRLCEVNNILQEEKNTRVKNVMKKRGNVEGGLKRKCRLLCSVKVENGHGIRVSRSRS